LPNQHEISALVSNSFANGIQRPKKDFLYSLFKLSILWLKMSQIFSSLKIQKSLKLLEFYF
jgi:hypothetical protein